MKTRQIIACALAAILLAPGAAVSEERAWKAWSAAEFEQARKDNKFVILDLEAVWCHWCHVMRETTYQDPKVTALLESRYVTIRVDQDANPDLAARYGDWGWPATIIFAPDGAELVKRRGYIAPENMASLLQAVIDDPTPGPSVGEVAEIAPADSAFLSKDARAQLEQTFAEAYDTPNGGWGRGHKYIDPDSMDWALLQAERGDKAAKIMATATLGRANALIDPAWGGIYQYSDSMDWRSPHYEKIMSYQASGLRQYASAYAQFKDPAYLGAARDIYRYLASKLLSPEGAFFATQDADVDRKMPGKEFYALTREQREALGREPRIDRNLYARENGWAISALAAFSNATGDAAALDQAVRAAKWVVANRQNPDGTFRHGQSDRGGPYIGDTMAMGNAAMDLYAATGDRTWLTLAQSAGKALARFQDPDGGFKTSLEPEGTFGVLASPHKAIDEQVLAGRLSARLWRYLGDPDAKAMAEHAAKYLASPAIIESGRAVPGTLLLDDELSREPTHITVVGRKDDAEAIALHRGALLYPAMNKRVDWWDVREGPLPNPDVTYPEMDRAAAFACGNRLCSQPAFSADELKMVVAQMLKAATDMPIQ